ncbi:MAG TPA: 6-phosphogluconolactonase [Pyrinomonadaceae bacterium]|nr:6-phosphogluconolactonase [Pyrinomonadaceae bacterium]
MRQILRKSNVEELNKAAAGLFVAAAIESVALRGKFSVALSGGSTPRALYTLLASDNYRNKIDWSKTTIFFGDERNVPPDSHESNYRMADETLLTPLKIRTRNVNRWKTERGPVEAAADYDSQLRSNGPLDLVLLGLGPDAHTASLFPNTDAIREKEKLAVANWVEKLNDHRLTMTFPAINSAREVMFLVAGGDKADAVASVLEGKSRLDEYPAQGVKSSAGNVIWLIDAAAASRLKNK